MNGFNKCIFHKNTYITNPLYSAIILGTIFASSAVLAEVPTEITKYTLQREKSVNHAQSSLHEEQVPEIEILEQSGVYQIKVVAVIDAPARHVRHALTDYRHIYRLNPSIIESKVVKRHDDDSVSVKTKVVGCAAYFCEELERVERVRVLPSGDLLAEIVPELSQFKSGQTLWHIKPMGEHCEVNYIADMEPDIFIPPVVGKFLIKKAIREEMLTSFANLGKISNVLAEREWRDDYMPVHAEFASNNPCVNFAENSLNKAY